MAFGSVPVRAARAVAWVVTRRRRGGAGGGLVRRALLASGRHALGHIGAVVRHLALQIFGAVFLFFAAGFGYHGVIGWRSFERHGGSNSLPLTEILLALLFAYFGISSFFRAGQGRSESQSQSQS